MKLNYCLKIENFIKKSIKKKYKVTICICQSILCLHKREKKIKDFVSDSNTNKEGLLKSLNSHFYTS